MSNATPVLPVLPQHAGLSWKIFYVVILLRLSFMFYLAMFYLTMFYLTMFYLTMFFVFYIATRR